MKSILIVALGGAVGSVLRYLIGLLAKSLFIGNFPWGTFIVNIAGCFAIGIFFGLSARQEWMNEPMRLLLMTGLCGGFTTFSAFALENLNLFQQGNYFLGASYIAASIILGIGTVFAGFALAR